MTRGGFDGPTIVDLELTWEQDKMAPKRKETATASGSHPTPTAKRSKTLMDTAAIQAMKCKALSGNMKGVRIANQALENKGPVLAGYLFLPDTKALRDVLTDSVIQREILEPWRLARAVGFGVVTKDKKTNWQKATI